ncbi:MAG: enoyl-CoA hydratase/isomerase family protein, partial [Pseudomonadota bacterium]|nr:enoyl-CoA hydratase/isomerase family protein [Pseudomonadota bacterium]
MATGAIDTGTEQLLCEVRDRVALITLNRPESRNALGDIITPALRRQIRERGDDPDVGALLITGAGTAFCAGGDVKGMGNNRPTVELSHDQKVARLKKRQRT